MAMMLLAATQFDSQYCKYMYKGPAVAFMPQALREHDLALYKRKVKKIKND